ncbi:CpxP family protein [Vibrio sp. FNV 38]|nr:CpxP family protein [Vibrio sp. FNV 38]
MMKKVNKWLMAAAVIPLSLSAASVWAFGGANGPQGGMGKCGGERAAMKKLDLTEDQKAQLKELRESNKAEREDRKANREDNKAQRDAHKAQMKALMLSDTFDRASAEELATTMVEQQTERRVTMMEKKHQMMQILTVDQREQLLEAQEKQMEKCKDKMQKKQQNKKQNKEKSDS